MNYFIFEKEGSARSYRGSDKTGKMSAEIFFNEDHQVWWLTVRYKKEVLKSLALCRAEHLYLVEEAVCSSIRKKWNDEENELLNQPTLEIPDNVVAEIKDKAA